MSPMSRMKRDKVGLLFAFRDFCVDRAPPKWSKGVGHTARAQRLVASDEGSPHQCLHIAIPSFSLRTLNAATPGIQKKASSRSFKSRHAIIVANRSSFDARDRYKVCVLPTRFHDQSGFAAEAPGLLRAGTFPVA